MKVLLNELRYDEPQIAHEALHYEAAAVARCLAPSTQ